MTPKDGQPVTIDINDKHEAVSISPASLPTFEVPEETSLVSEPPTVLSSMAEATTIFQRMRRDWQRESQCYNRAHIWAYEENKRHGTVLQKIFVFYTKRYIRNYRFYWWFHAIPAVSVGPELITLARRYDRSPLTMKPWTDLFVRSGRACPVITRYTDYSQHQEAEDCYLHFASQYFWQPRDLETFERTGAEKTSFITREVNHAYWEAF